MAAFYDYRKTSLSEPIDGEDVAFFAFDDNIQKKAKSIKRIIYEGTRGSFLIAGDRGSGKSSFVNLLLNKQFKKKDSLVIKLSTVNYMIEEGILYGILEQIFNSELIDEALRNKVTPLYRKIRGDYIKSEKLEDSASNYYKKSQIETNEESAEAGIGSNKYLIGGIFGYTRRTSDESQSQANLTDKSSTTVEIIEKINPYYETEKLLIMLSEQYEVFIVFDELDKMGEDFLIELFDNYKALFVEKNIISLFIVDSKLFEKFYLDSNSELRTYFLYGAYIPLVEYEEFTKQCYQLFNIKNRNVINKLFFDTLGNRRLLNNACCSHSYDGVRPYLEARLFIEILEKCLELRDVELLKYDKEREEYERDVYLKTIKGLILRMLYLNGATEKDMEDYYNGYLMSTFPEFAKVMSKIKEIKNSCILQHPDGRIQINTRLLKYDSDDVYEEELYPQKEEVAHWRSLNHYQESVVPNSLILLGNNEEYAYKDALKPLVLTAGQRLKKLVLIELKEEGDWPSPSSSKSFSIVAAIRDVNDDITAYYNKKGAYRYEGSYIIKTLVEEFNHFGIDVYYHDHEKEIKDDEEIENVIKQVLKDDHLQIAKTENLFL